MESRSDLMKETVEKHGVDRPGSQYKEIPKFFVCGTKTKIEIAEKAIVEGKRGHLGMFHLPTKARPNRQVHLFALETSDLRLMYWPPRDGHGPYGHYEFYRFYFEPENGGDAMVLDYSTSFTIDGYCEACKLWSPAWWDNDQEKYIGGECTKCGNTGEDFWIPPDTEAKSNFRKAIERACNEGGVIPGGEDWHEQEIFIRYQAVKGKPYYAEFRQWGGGQSSASQTPPPKSDPIPENHDGVEEDEFAASHPPKAGPFSDKQQKMLDRAKTPIMRLAPEERTRSNILRYLTTPLSGFEQLTEQEAIHLWDNRTKWGWWE